MTYKEFITKSINSLSEIYSISESKAIAVRVLTHYLEITDYEYMIEPNTIIPKSHLVKLQEAVDELMNNRPVQYVLGYEEFAGHRFVVNENVLIPRPETEELYRMIVKKWGADKYQELKILDACTGSGCLAYSLAVDFPRANVMACDLSDGALKVASSQEIFVDIKKSKSLENKPLFFKWDILSGVPEGKDLESVPDLEGLDIIVSNPPYVCESERDFMSDNVLNYEPDMALFVPDNDPLRFYKALALWASELLRSGGMAFFEINEAYSRETVELFESYGFSDVETIDDIHNKPRFVSFTKWF